MVTPIPWDIRRCHLVIHMASYHPLALICQTMVAHMVDCPLIMTVVLEDTGAAVGATEAEHIAAARPLVDPETAGMK